MIQNCKREGGILEWLEKINEWIGSVKKKLKARTRAESPAVNTEATVERQHLRQREGNSTLMLTPSSVLGQSVNTGK